MSDLEVIRALFVFWAVWLLLTIADVLIHSARVGGCGKAGGDVTGAVHTRLRAGPAFPEPPAISPDSNRGGEDREIPTRLGYVNDDGAGLSLGPAPLSWAKVGARLGADIPSRFPAQSSATEADARPPSLADRKSA